MKTTPYAIALLILLVWMIWLAGGIEHTPISAQYEPVGEWDYLPELVRYESE